MISFEGWTVPPDFKSDGCTFPFIGLVLLGAVIGGCAWHFLGWPYPLSGFVALLLPQLMGAKKYRVACVMHDFLRRHICHYSMKPSESDKIFRRNLIALGCPKPVARLYWLGVKIMRPWFTKTSPLPVKWSSYGRFK